MRPQAEPERGWHVKRAGGSPSNTRWQQLYSRDCSGYIQTRVRIFYRYLKLLFTRSSRCLSSEET